MKTYTKEEVKKAFWKTFHKAGEIYFDNISWHTKESHEECTECYWVDFLENLKEAGE